MTQIVNLNIFEMILKGYNYCTQIMDYFFSSLESFSMRKKLCFFKRQSKLIILDVRSGKFTTIWSKTTARMNPRLQPILNWNKAHNRYIFAFL